MRQAQECWPPPWAISDQPLLSSEQLVADHGREAIECGSDGVSGLIDLEPWGELGRRQAAVQLHYGIHDRTCEISRVFALWTFGMQLAKNVP